RVAAFTFAPAAISRSAISRWSNRTASWSAVEPSASTAVTGTCCARSARTARAFPLLAASIKRRFPPAASRAPESNTTEPTFRNFIAAFLATVYYKRLLPRETGRYNHCRRPMAKLPYRIVAAVAAMLTSLPVHAEVASTQQASAAIGKYCASCHSAQVHTAGLVLDTTAVTHVQTD